MPIYSNSHKIINDPIYGLIPIPGGVAYEIINHPWFQRLRRIRQLGLTHLVYPGACHTRFQHTLGSVYLLQEALDVLRDKGIDITVDEAEGTVLAILLHDMGHGPFSHALEGMFFEKENHEAISLHYMHELNKQYEGSLDKAIQIFTNTYHKKFLHQLVSSQLDTDRLDYLKRDSFFTGVSEGVISTDRIIKMLNVTNDKIVVDQKGIYSIEKFLIARRLMYWQVYLHKTVVSAEQTLRHIIIRVKELARNNADYFSTPSLKFFFDNNPILNSNSLHYFSMIDDGDVLSSIKVWSTHSDRVLNYLSNAILNRKLMRVKISNQPFDINLVHDLKKRTAEFMKISVNEAKYLVVSNTLSNNTYHPFDDEITILFKDGKTQNIIEASDMFNHATMSKTVLKYYLCYPKELDN